MSTPTQPIRRICLDSEDGGEHLPIHIHWRDVRHLEALGFRPVNLDFGDGYERWQGPADKLDEAYYQWGYEDAA